MSNLELMVNKKIEVIDDSKPYKSIIQDVENEEFKISVPVNDGLYLSLRAGEEVKLRYYKGELGCYAFNAKVVDRGIDNNVYLYKLSTPYNIRKIQRRNFVRVNTVEYSFFCMIKPGEEIKWNKGIITDLSGGGLRLKIKENTKLGDRIIVNIPVDGEKISVKGEVVRIEKTETKEYMCGINFVDIRETDRDKIITKVFQLMRKQRGVL